jgi:hypothetical protein
MLGFFLSDLLKENLNKLFVTMVPELYFSIEIIENSRKTTDFMKIQFLI